MKKIYLFLILFISATLFADNQTFTYTGSTQTLTVPSGVTEMTFKIWGAGGAGGPYGADGGGSGGYSEGTFTVTPGDNLIIAVGGGGIHATTSGGGNGGWPGGGYGTAGDADGGGGGGYSGVFIGSHTHGNSLIIAGGGGAGTGYRWGGAGGGTSGNAGNGPGGNGGTQSAGGTGTNGDDGSALQGGNGGESGSQNTSSADDGGGGGGGYYGGEGGYDDARGGGGGSGYINSTYVVGSGTLTTGNDGTTSSGGGGVNTSYAEYQSGVGVGSNYSTDAGNGLIYVEWSASAPATAPTTQATAVTFANVTNSSMDISWTNGNGSSRAVFVSAASSGSATPVDETTYTANTTFGSGTQIGTTGWYCVYNGTGTSVSLTGLSMETTYSVHVTEFNSGGTGDIYFTETASGNPATQTTPLIAPSTQATNITFANIAGTSMDISWTNGNGANRAVFIAAASSGSASPVDETTYTASTTFGSGTQIGTSGWYCVYNGTGTSVSVSDLSALTTYSVFVTEYNGSSGSEMYLTSTATNNPNTQITTPEGAGTTDDPYVISSLEALEWISTHSSYWGDHYIQTADINASATANWNGGDHDNNASTPDSAMGFSPIGNNTTEFTGTYNGQNFTIDSLYINKPATSYIGLFGKTNNAAISNLGVTHVDFTCQNYSAGLVGYSGNSSSITNSYATGSVSGLHYVGGLVGDSYNSTVTSSYATGSVNGSDYIGGLVGYSYNSTLTSSYATGSVNGSYRTGGLVGYNYISTVDSSYATGNVSSSSNYTGGLVGYGYISTVNSSYATGLVSGINFVGGLVGENNNSSTISNSYATGNVSGSGYIGGLVGYSTSSTVNSSYANGLVSGTTNYIGGLIGYGPGSTVSYSYWDTEASGQTTSHGGVGKTTYEMKTLATYVISGPWDFERNPISDTANDDIWDLDITGTINNGYPYLAWQDGETISLPATPSGSGTTADPYQMSTLSDLAWLSMNYKGGGVQSAHYIQTANINAGDTRNWMVGNHDVDDGTTPDSAMGFIPIGDSGHYFTGTYNGQNYTIDSLFIDRKIDYTGLFGDVRNTNTTIENLNLNNVNITGHSQTGALVGHHYGYASINNCSSSGIVKSGTGSTIGGLVGFTYSYTTIDSSHSSCTVTSGGYGVGGLVGNTYINATISNSYSTGAVTSTNANAYVGGLVGKNRSNALIINSYSTSPVTGTMYVGGLVGYNENNADIRNSYSTGAVTASSTYAGGLVGRNYFGQVYNSHSSSSVTSTSSNVGGLAGGNSDLIENSYATGNIEGDSRVGGLIGYHGGTNGVLTHSYSTGTVTGTSEYGGLIGFIATDPTTITASFWNTETSGMGASNGGTGLTTADMQTLLTFTGVSWDFTSETGNGTDDDWDMDISTTINNGFPYLSWEDGIDVSLQAPGGAGTSGDPYLVSNINELWWISQNAGAWASFYQQTANINASVSTTWAAGTGFSPIGNATTRFTGTYDGNNFTIDSLFINRVTTSNLGLFGKAEGAAIASLGMTNVNFTGYEKVGGIVGEMTASSSITSCFSTGSLTANSNYAGGLAGNIDAGTMNDSYSKASVTAADYAGGLAGALANSSTLTNVYATGSVNNGNSGTNVGGLIGENPASTVSNSFWDTETSGQSTGNGGTGKSTAVMKILATYTTTATDGLSASWDFETNPGEDTGTDDIWDMDLSGTTNAGYPYLSWQDGSTVSLVTPPTTQATTITSANLSDVSMDLSWTNGNGSNRAVFMKQVTSTSDYNLVFNETTDENEYTRVSPFSMNTNNFTIEARVKRTASTSGYSWAVATSYVGLGINNSTGNFSAIVNNSTSGLETTVEAELDTWYHIALVRNSGSYELYIDGVAHNLTGTATPSSVVLLHIGGRGTSGNWAGNIDEVRVWNSVRTASEIQDNMNSGLAGNESGLIAYYPMNEGSGTTLPDHSSNAYDMTFYNMDETNWQSLLALTPSTPITGNTYTASTSFGGGTQIGETGWYCVYNGTGNSVSVNGLFNGTSYDVHVAEYNTADFGSAFYNANSASGNPARFTTVTTAPPTQASSIITTNLVNNGVDLSWTNGDGAKRAVFGKVGTDGASAPVNATVYAANAAFGSGDQIDTTGWYCLFNGTGNSVSVTGLSGDTNYRFHVVDYNENDNGPLYNVDVVINNPRNVNTPPAPPTVQATNVTYSNIYAEGMTVSWASGNGSRRTAFMKIGHDLNGASPVDGTPYAGGDSTLWNDGTQIGNSGWYCIYDGTGSTVVLTGTASGQIYTVHVTEYNGANGSQVYNTSTSATNNPKSTVTDTPAGSGTTADPYQIAIEAHIDWISASTSRWNKHYIQVADIVMDWATTPHISIGNVSANFTGSYDGQGHTISDLYQFDTNLSYQGLFGKTYNASISNLGLIHSKTYSAAAGGQNYNGALVGYNQSTPISNCYSDSTSVIVGNAFVGGLVGFNYISTINDSYSRATVQAYGNYKGGLVGYSSAGTLLRCYAAGPVSSTGGSYIGGLCGWSNGTITNSFWDTETTNQSTSSGGGTGKTTAEMKTITTFTGATWDFEAETANGANDHWDFDRTGSINYGYPYLSWQDGEATSLQAPTGTGETDAPYQIANLDHLFWMLLNTNKYDKKFIQTADIDATETSTWSAGAGFTPIGTYSAPFTGIYDGQNYTITGLYMNYPSDNYVGFFGELDGNGTLVSNLTLANANVTGYGYSGILCGYVNNSASVQNCNVSGSLTGNMRNNGGLVGWLNNGTISNSTAECTVVGLSYGHGGLVGFVENGSIISGSSASGTIRGTYHLGGLVGRLYGNSQIQNSFATVNLDTCTYYSGGLVGYTGNSIVNNSYAAGNINSTASNIGGLVGKASNSSTISNSYATGNILASTDAAGGLVGRVELNTSVLNSYSLGSVNCSGSNKGGLIGQDYQSTATVSNSFWDVDSSGMTTSWGGVGKTTEEMKSLLTYTTLNWDFESENNAGTDDNWDFDFTGTINNGYPYLSFQDGDAVSLLGPSGIGLANDPFQISTADHVHWMSYFPGHYGDVFQQTADINMANPTIWVAITDTSQEKFLPIGSEENPFTGSYDGQTFAINNLTVNRPQSDNAGLFYRTNNAAVSNITLNTATVTGQDNVAGLSGRSNNSTFTNCTINGAINGQNNVGGLVGNALAATTITGGNSSAAITATGNTAGGLIGLNDGSTLTSSQSSATVTAVNNAGGLTGKHISSATISNSFSTGTVTATGNTAGGITGLSDASIVSGSFANGTVTAVQKAGGAVGVLQASSSILNSYAKGTATADSIVGGLVGSSNASTINNAYGVGSVTGTGSGGLVGIGSGSTVTNSFWDTDSTGETASAGGTGKPFTAMTFLPTYTNTETAGLTTAWDFEVNPYDDTADDNIWDMGLRNEGYPYLAWEDGETVSLSVPGTQSVNIVSGVLETSMNLYWTSGTGQHRVVFMKAGTDGEANPADGTAYAPNSAFGQGAQIGTSGWYSVYDGLGDNVTVTGLNSETGYRIHVCEVNGQNGTEFYNRTTANGNPVNATTIILQVYVEGGVAYVPDVTQGTTTQPLGLFRLTSRAQDTHTFTGISLQIDGARQGVGNFKLFASADDSFDVALDTVQLGSTVAVDPGAGNSVSFSGFTRAVDTTGTNFYFLTADLAGNASGFIQAVIDSSSDVVFSPSFEAGAAYEGLALSGGDVTLGAGIVTLMGNAGFRMMSSPVQAVSLDDLLDELWVQGMDGGDISGSTPNIWSLNGSTQTWQPLTSLTNSGLVPGQGFLIYVFEDTDGDGDNDLAGGVNLSVWGTVNNGIISAPTTAGSGENADYNLLGNPYGNTIYANQLFQDNQSFGHSVYIFDPALNNNAGGYRSWNGIAGDIDNGLISAYQGFLIQSNGQETFHFTPECSEAPGTFYRDNDSTGMVPFTVTADGFESNFYLSFSNFGEEEMDGGDAQKLLPMQMASHLAGMFTADDASYSINNLPYAFIGSIELPLDVMMLSVNDDAFATEETNAVLSWDTAQLPDHVTCELVNQSTGEILDMATVSETNFLTVEKGGFSSAAGSQFNAYPVVGESIFSLRVTSSLLSLDNVSLPTEFALYPAYPNPFNPKTNIHFDIPMDVNNAVSLQIYDIRGRRVETLIHNELLEPGQYKIAWNADQNASGIYFIRLQHGSKIKHQKITLLK